jgi:hypothetical protein
MTIRPTYIHDGEVVYPSPPNSVSVSSSLGSPARPEPTPGTPDEPRDDETGETQAERDACFGPTLATYDELTTAYFAQLAHTDAVRSLYQTRVAALESRLASLTESSRRSEEERALAEAERDEYKALAIKYGSRVEGRRLVGERVLHGSIKIAEDVVRLARTDAINAACADLAGQFRAALPRSEEP